MKISVIGCGRWGTFIAWYLGKLSYSVMLYGRSESLKFQELCLLRKNDYLELPDKVVLTSDIKEICKSEIIVISVGSQSLRQLCKELAREKIKNKIIVLCMKGIETGTDLRLSQVAEDILDSSNKIAVWIGPGHVQDYYAGIPNCMVIDSKNESIKNFLIEQFSSKLIRFYYGSDMIGNEVGAALKNVIGVAAGMLDGLGMSSLKGALMARGTREVSRLIEAMGGKAISAYGLCHLGDYEATVFSPHSHNRGFGEAFVKGESYKGLAEGYYTAKATAELCEKYGVDMPICQSVYNVLYKKMDPKSAVYALFERKLNVEFGGTK